MPCAQPSCVSPPNGPPASQGSLLALCRLALSDHARFLFFPVTLENQTDARSCVLMGLVLGGLMAYRIMCSSARVLAKCPRPTLRNSSPIFRTQCGSHGRLYKPRVCRRRGYISPPPLSEPSLSPSPSPNPSPSLSLSLSLSPATLRMSHPRAIPRH